MAVHRYPPLEFAPTRLLDFDPAEWAEAADVAWWQPFERWKTARRDWVRQQPDSVLGDFLDLMKAERLVWASHLEAAGGGAG